MSAFYLNFLLLVLFLPFTTLANSASPSSLQFQQSYSVIWGQPNSQGNIVQLNLNKNSGSGIKSLRNYKFGIFTASIKLPGSYSAGVVTAFYASNNEEYPQSHDELDFEFLGVVPGMPYILQTNVYGDGSVNKGREERFHLWFDPTADFHRYTIYWSAYQIIFFVDDIPIRQMMKSEKLQTEYPAKPMTIYSTIWDGSVWATEGGKYPVDYTYQPFIASFTDFNLQGGCTHETNCSEPTKQTELYYQHLDEQQLNWVRANHMVYSYCDDRQRYPSPLDECRVSTPAKSSRKEMSSLYDHKKPKFDSLSPALRLAKHL